MASSVWKRFESPAGGAGTSEGRLRGADGHAQRSSRLSEHHHHWQSGSLGAKDIGPKGFQPWKWTGCETLFQSWPIEFGAVPCRLGPSAPSPTGTGKTTFARLLARFFHTYGVLPKDSFVEKNGLELKAEFMGGTAPRVKAAVAEAMGGCLFLDEAYALMDSAAGVGGAGDAFSQEALRTLLTEVENHRTNLMVVLAGYKEKMGRLMRAEDRRTSLRNVKKMEMARVLEGNQLLRRGLHGFSTSTWGV